MKANIQDVCRQLDIVVITKGEGGSFLVYGLESVAVVDSVVDGMELAFNDDFTHQDILVSKEARMKDV